MQHQSLFLRIARCSTALCLPLVLAACWGANTTPLKAASTASIPTRFANYRLDFIAPFQGSYAGLCNTVGSTAFTQSALTISRLGAFTTPIGSFDFTSPSTSLIITDSLGGSIPIGYSIEATMNMKNSNWVSSIYWKDHAGIFRQDTASYTNSTLNGCSVGKGVAATSLAAPVSLTAIATTIMQQARGSCAQLPFGATKLAYSFNKNTFYLGKNSYNLTDNLTLEGIQIDADVTDSQAQTDSQFVYTARFSGNNSIAIYYSQKHHVHQLILNGQMYGCS